MNNISKIKHARISVYLIYSFLFFLTIIPLLIFKYPVLVDYLNHLAGFYIQANIDQDLWLKNNYRVNWSINPYMLIEALGGALARYMDIFIAGKMIIIIGFLLLCSGAVLIRKFLIGRIDLWTVTAFVFLYNYILFYGFLNYYVGSGVALIAMATWIRFRHISFLRHTILFSLLSTLLFFTHLFALGIYGFFVICYEIGVYKYSRQKFLITDCVKAFSQFLPPFILFVIWWVNLQKYDVGEFYDYGDMPAKIIALLSPVNFDLSNSSIFIVLFMLISVLIARIRYPGGVGIYQNMKIPILGFLILLVITPRSLLGVWAVDCRLPFIFMILLIASVKFDENEKNTVALRKYIILIAVITVCLKIYFISSTWNKVGRQYAEFEDALQFVNNGSKIITVQEDSKQLKGLDFILYHHMTALAVIKRSAFWPLVFTAMTPILPSAQTAPIDSPSGAQLKIADLLNNKLMNGYVYGKGAVVYWENWTQDFDYLVSIRFENVSVIELKNLKLIFKGSFFDIYQIIH